MLLLLLSLAGALVTGWWIAMAARCGGWPQFVLAWATGSIVAMVSVGIVVGGLLKTWTAPAALIATLMLAALSTVAGRRWAHASTPPRPALPVVRRGRPVPLTVVAACLVAVTAAVYAYLAACAILLPATTSDALLYHLPSSYGWVQQGSLDALGWSSPWSDRYPGNTWLLFGWPQLFLDVQVVEIWQIPLVLLGALAVFVIARTLGAPRTWAVIGGCVYALMPVAMLQAPIPYVDAAYATYGLIAIAFVLPTVVPGARLARTWPQLVLAGAALGLMLGTKYAGLVGAGVIVLAASVGLAVRGHNIRAVQSWWRDVVGMWVCVLPGLLVFGFSWYLRNWVRFGNPVEPFTLALGPLTLISGDGSPADLISTPQAVKSGLSPGLAGIVQSWWSDLRVFGGSAPIGDVTTVDPWLFSYDVRVGGFGPWWLLLGVPSLIALVVLLRRTTLRTPAIVVVLIAGLSLLIGEAAWWSRFSILVAGLGAAAVAAVLGSTRIPRGIAPVGLVVIALSVIATLPHTVPVRWPGGSTGLFGTRAALAESLALPADARKSMTRAYPGLACLDGPGTTVAYDPNDTRGSQRVRSGQLLGVRLQHTVTKLGADIDDLPRGTLIVIVSRGARATALVGRPDVRVLSKDPAFTCLST